MASKYQQNRKNHHFNNNVLSTSPSFIPVHSLWICRGNEILAESQIGTSKINAKQTKFVKIFVDQVINPAKPSGNNININPSFTIYVKKRLYLFHVLYYNDLTFLSLTRDTLQQQPLDEIFDLLYNIKSAFLFEDTDMISFSDTLGDLHHSYQIRSKPKVSVIDNIINNANDNNSFNLFSSDDERHTDDDDGNFKFVDGYSIGNEESQSANNNNLGIDYHRKNKSKSSKTFQTTLNLPSPSPSPSPRRHHNIVQNFNGHQHNKSKSRSSTSKYHMRTPSTSTGAISTTRPGTGAAQSALALNVNHTNSTINNMDNNLNNGNFISDDDEKLSDSNNGNINLTFFVLKKGWMTKLGNKFKTWRYRYFELWSNGLLNYFEDEMKIKKKGSLNIIDEVISCDLYDKVSEQNDNVGSYWNVNSLFGTKNKLTTPRNNNNNNSTKKEFGFMIQTHERCWYFTLNKKETRDDWFLLIQTITFAKIDLNQKWNTFKRRFDKLEFRWDSHFKDIEFDLNCSFQDDLYNIYQLQYDLIAARNICYKLKKEIVCFKGSDLFPTYLQKVENQTENIQGALSTVDAIIHSRNENQIYNKQSLPKYRRNKSSKRHSHNSYNSYNQKRPKTTRPNTLGYDMINNNKLSRVRSLSNRSPSRHRSSFVGIDENRVVLKGKIKVKLPSKSILGSKTSLSKKIKLLNVVVQQKFFKINIDRDMTAPLIWKFDDLLAIQDIKGVYYGRKKRASINLSDIQQYELTVIHSSERRVQFLFDTEENAFLWYRTLNTLFSKYNDDDIVKQINNLPTSPVLEKNIHFNSGQIAM